MSDRRKVASNDNDEYRFYVYAWLRPDGSPFYVGKGCGNRDVQPKKTNNIFMRTLAKIKRDGAEPLIVRWQDGLSENDAHRLEVTYIKLFGRRNNETGILSNLTDGGEGNSGWIPSTETRRKVSLSKIGKKPSAETREKISKSQLGRVHTDEARAKMSASHLGVPKSEEVKAKMSGARRGKGKPNDDHLEKLRTAARMAPPKSGFKGVHAIGNRWRAGIRIDGKNKYIGTFNTPEEAASAYDRVATDAWGHGKCYLNAPVLTNL